MRKDAKLLHLDGGQCQREEIAHYIEAQKDT